jgi:hypothetical protein
MRALSLSVAIVTTTLLLQGCLATMGAATNDAILLVTTSATTDQALQLRRYGIKNREQMTLAAEEMRREGYSSSTTIPILLSYLRDKEAATKDGLSISQFLKVKNENQQLAQKERSRLIGLIKTNDKSDTTLTLTEPIYLSCKTFIEPKGGAAGKWRHHFLKINNQSADSVSVYDSTHKTAGYAESINLDVPISVEKLSIRIEIKTSPTSRAWAVLERDTLRLRLNDAHQYNGKWMFFSDGYFDCNLSTAEQKNWQEKVRKEYLLNIEKQKSREKEQLDQRLNQRKF